MRGFLAPSVKSQASESQRAFAALGRGRRVKLATAAKTTLVKADQWGRGDGVTADVAGALDQVVSAHIAKAAKKK
jgi:hypothetical protein